MGLVTESRGRPFGSYVLLKRLARGGMAEVFLGRQRGLQGFDRLVAVKRVLPHLVDSHEFIPMFFDEARLAAKIAHPNCVHIYEFGQVLDDYFIAMEYVHGVHAGQLIAHAAHEPIPPVLVARLGADACLGLHYAHELRDEAGRPLGIVHRDVSPPNLLISYDGTTKLVDFGIAKAAISVEQTRPGVVKGKYAYMSPEQTVGRKLTSKSDVFSLALAMWELLAGRVAVTREDKVAAMTVLRDGRLPPIESARHDVPPPLSRALSRALEVDPDRRMSALEFKLALEEFIKTQPGLGSSFELGQWITQRFPWERPTGDSEIDELLTRATTHVPAAGGAMDGSWMEAERPARLDDDNKPTMVLLDPRFTGATPPVSAGEPDEATEISAGPPAPDLGSLPEARRRPEIASPVTALAASLQPIRSPPDPHARAKTIAIAAGAAIVLGAVVLAMVSEDAREPAEPSPAAAREAQPPAPTDPDPAAARPRPRAGEQPATPAAALEVRVSPPGALVALGDRPAVAAPARFAELAAGTHVVRVARDGFVPIERTVTLSTGQAERLELAMIPVPASDGAATTEAAGSVPPGPVLPDTTSASRSRARDRRPGQLIARTVPYSVAYLNGRKLDTTPFTRDLPPGRYTLVFRHPEHAPQHKTVTIRPGRKTKLSFPLR
jgi:serine/threonine-protein kinase